MICYASRTATGRNIAALKAAGWGWMVGPLDGRGERLHGMRHALDNGAWSAFAQGRPWDEGAFRVALDRFGPAADFIVVPDVVADREVSLARTRAWLPGLLARPDLGAARLLIAIQDGMTFADIEPLLANPRVGLFIGGSTEWKLAAIEPWGRWAKARGRYVHCGRVNTARRIAICAGAGVDSIDGTSATRFAKTLPLLTRAAAQPDLLAPPRRIECPTL